MKKAHHHQAHGHAKKHTHHKKHIHHHRAKHHPVHHKAAHHAHKAGHVKTVGHHPKRHLSLGEVACCAAEALAASLRLAGASVCDADVLELYWRTASYPSEGATLLDTLRAAQEHGLAGWRPGFAPCDLSGGGVDGAAELTFEPFGSRAGLRLQAGEQQHLQHGIHGLIVGLQLGKSGEFPHWPSGGSHALTLADCGCCAWSWGELYSLDSFGAGPAEEAWAVSWS